VEHEAFDAVVLDCQLPDASGLDLLQRIQHLCPSTRVIVMTAYSTVELAVDAMKRGAADFRAKPLDVADMVRSLRDATASAAGRATPTESTSELIGDSELMQRARLMIERIAASPVATVLITGESGTGKDLAARAVHRASDRASRPFVNITCSALPESLLESELFGHEAGAFTSAAHQKRGLLEAADGGTVFLDEIAEMTPQLQAKLLRFCEERAFRRLGGTKDRRVDVRIIAATHRDLNAAVASGEFRQDLYYRLRVVSLEMPPLRRRKEDIPSLATHFTSTFARIFARPVRGLLPETLEHLQGHHWPGNCRELKHLIEQAVVLGSGELLTPEDCPLQQQRRQGSGLHAFNLPPEGVVLSQLEESLVVQALELSGWNQARAGKLLGLNRDQIRYRIDKFHITKPASGGHAA
jgi:DNA-binding NtrC family response regulator